jgi:hypothetical protein
MLRGLGSSSTFQCLPSPITNPSLDRHMTSASVNSKVLPSLKRDLEKKRDFEPSNRAAEKVTLLTSPFVGLARVF